MSYNISLLLELLSHTVGLALIVTDDHDCGLFAHFDRFLQKVLKDTIFLEVEMARCAQVDMILADDHRVVIKLEQLCGFCNLLSSGMASKDNLAFLELMQRSQDRFLRFRVSHHKLGLDHKSGYERP